MHLRQNRNNALHGSVRLAVAAINSLEVVFFDGLSKNNFASLRGPISAPGGAG